MGYQVISAQMENVLAVSASGILELSGLGKTDAPIGRCVTMATMDFKDSGSLHSIRFTAENSRNGTAGIKLSQAVAATVSWNAILSSPATI